jgi:glyoxylase-like metal-dependent hydrolase (beta-lactamase superfamily II)
MTTPDPAPTYRVTLLRAGIFKLDAGAMFGLIPRTVWSRSAKVDDKQRITVSHNCLLLERVGEPKPGEPRRILLEAGTGDKLDPKMREVFELEKIPGTDTPRSIATALAEINIAPESIDLVVVSHLHFDHAGGLTRLPKPGEKPAFLFNHETDGGGGSSQSGGCNLTFPNARIVIQQREWSDAVVNRSVMTKTYYPDHLSPIADRLNLVDSPRPFPSGYVPERDESPRTSIHQRTTEVAPGIHVFLVPGHTWGQQATLVDNAVLNIEAPTTPPRPLVFTPDVLPTAAHVGAAYSLAYDVEAYTSMVTKRWFLTEAAEHHWTLCLDHEPGGPFFRVNANTKGWFDLVP